MSSEGENGKTQQNETNDVKVEEDGDTIKKNNISPKPTEEVNKSDVKESDTAKDQKEDVKDGKDAKKEEKPVKEVDKPKVEKNDIDDESDKEDTEKEDDKEDEEDEEEEEEEEVVKTPRKDKKKPQKSTDDKDKDDQTDIPEGSGLKLSEIPRIDASISRFKNDDLKLFHRLLFKTQGKTQQIKKNIRNFNGFDFKKDSAEYTKRLAAIEKFELKQLRIVCEMLDLEKKGDKTEISERILAFLIEPKDSGKAVGGGRPKRTAAVRANNRGYSSHDDSYSSDERPRSKRNMGRRANLKDETSSGSDEEFHPTDSEEERPRVKRKRTPRRKKEQSEEEDEESEVETATSDESDDDAPKSKKKKVTNSKAKGKGPGRGRGRRPAAAAAAASPTKKKTPARRGRKRAQESSEEEESEDAHDDEGSSSEDEPLAKKTAKPQPPTDEEIKTYVKEILEGANLEEITMKTVCKQVYAHYPDFDLTHKKNYIKTTVKSLIST